MPSLDLQLTNRVKGWLRATKISQRELSRLLKIDPGNLNGWLSGSKALSAEKITSLLQLINLNQVQLAERLAVKEIHVEHFTENGKPMRLDSNGGWVPGQSGDDPNNMGGDVTTVRSIGAEGDRPDLDATARVLSQVDAFHAKAREAIADWFANNYKAKPNAAGVTSAPRKISDNQTSRTPGSRGDLLPSPEKLRDHLEWVRTERKKAEEQVRLEAELATERKLLWQARSEATA